MANALKNGVKCETTAAHQASRNAPSEQLHRSAEHKVLSALPGLCGLHVGGEHGGHSGEVSLLPASMFVVSEMLVFLYAHHYSSCCFGRYTFKNIS